MKGFYGIVDAPDDAYAAVLLTERLLARSGAPDVFRATTERRGRLGRS